MNKKLKRTNLIQEALISMYNATSSPDKCLEISEEKENVELPARHYTVYDNLYRPCPPTTNSLPPGLYQCDSDNAGLYFYKIDINTSDLIRFPGSIPDNIIKEFDTFWTRKPLYEERGEPHKRGFLLWGPPGGGKTCTTSMIMKDFIDAGNIVFQFSYMVTDGIQKLRSIEPERRVMVVIEDIDSFLQHGDTEQKLLQFLDGDRQFSNIVVIATTNYPEQLGDRIINRPSRFDRIEFIGMPSDEDRMLYLKTKTKTTPEESLVKWVADTEDWTLAHVKELILAVEIFGLPYEETKDRLNEMRAKRATSEAYTNRLRGMSGPGFGR